jgi:hypothetical protein
MHNLHIKNISDDLYPHLRYMLENFEASKKLEIEEEYDYENNYPKSVVCSSVAEVRRRVKEAEEEQSMSEEEYEREMDRFFEEEIGIKRR